MVIITQSEFSDECVLFFHFAELESLEIYGVSLEIFRFRQNVVGYFRVLSLKRVHKINLKVKNIPTSLFYFDYITTFNLSSGKYKQKFTQPPIWIIRKGCAVMNVFLLYKHLTKILINCR